MESYSAVKVDVTTTKAPLQAQAQGSGLRLRVVSRNIPPVPGTAAMSCPASGLPFQPSSLVSGVPQGWLMPWSGNWASPYTSNLPCAP